MRKFLSALVLSGALALASCTTTPTVTPVAKAPEPVGQPLPYRWTHGNAEKSRKAMIETFHKAFLPTGEFVWAETMPTEGEPKIIIDLLTQTAYAYQGDVLVGAASVSSAKTGKVTPLGLAAIKEMIRSSWSHTLDQELNHQRDAMRRLGFSEDYREGVAAFLEKRQPNFVGR